METKEKVQQAAAKATGGELPSNEQLKSALGVAEKALQQEKANLGPEGKQVAKDVQELAAAARVFLDEKNPNESLQKIYAEAFKLRTLPQDVLDKATGLPLDNDLRLAQESLGHLRYVGFLILNSASFRRLILRFFDAVGVAAREKMDDIDTTPLKEESKTTMEAIQQTAQSAKDTLQNKEWRLQESEKEELKQNLREIFRQVGGNTHFQKGMESLFLLFDRLADQLRMKAEQTKGLQQQVKRNPHVQNLLDESYNFMSGLIGKDILETVNDNLQKLYHQLKSDPGAKSWYNDFRDFYHKSIQNPSLFESEDHREKAINLIDGARDLGERTQNWRAIRQINKEMRRMVMRINNDVSRMRLTNTTNKLIKDLLYDEYGRFSLNTEAMTQIRAVLVPALLDQLKSIPVPRIENHEEGDYEYIIDNLNFNATNLVPEKIKISTYSQMKLKPKKMALKNAETTLRIKLKDIEVHLRGVKLWYKRKSFPKIEDDVTTDIDIGGAGTNLIIEMQVAKPSEESDMFRTVHVDSYIQDLSITATSGKHDVLMNIFTTLFSGVIKRRLKAEIDKQILKGMVTVDQSLNQVSKQLPKIESGVQNILYESYDQIKQYVGTETTGYPTLSQGMAQAQYEKLQ